MTVMKTVGTSAVSVKISRARFDGTTVPDQNGITARFTTRVKGTAKLSANWGGHNFVYEVDLTNETDGTGNVTLPNQEPAPLTNMSFPVAAKDRWTLVLKNAETGFGPTELTATITWP